MFLKLHGVLVPLKLQDTHKGLLIVEVLLYILIPTYASRGIPKTMFLKVKENSLEFMLPQPGMPRGEFPRECSSRPRKTALKYMLQHQQYLLRRDLIVRPLCLPSQNEDNVAVYCK